jgi:raffinose/stachyose/melibiose transport system permease protein
MNVTEAKRIAEGKPVAQLRSERSLYPTLLKYLAIFVRYAVLILFALICLVPIFWVISSSLKLPREIALNPLGFPPAFRIENYVEAWTAGRFGRYFWNSVIVSLPIVVGTLLLASFAGYGLARLKFRGAAVIFYTFLLGLMVPFQSVMIPLFYILKDIGFLGTYLAMIVPSIALGLPFGVFFMRAFFAGLPNELADAAEIDGCTEWDVFWRVMVPLAGPAVSTLAVLSFMGAWNAFLLPLIYMQKESLRPLVIGLMFFRDAYTQNVPLTMAGATIVMLPIIVVYLFFQRKFIQGLTAGALK